MGMPGKGVFEDENEQKRTRLRGEGKKKSTKTRRAQTASRSQRRQAAGSSKHGSVSEEGRYMLRAARGGKYG